MEEITAESLRRTDLRKIALNPNLGSLNFESLLPILDKLKDLFTDLQDLDYENNLAPSETSVINNGINQFIGDLRLMQNFNIAQESPQTAHDDLETTIKNFYSLISTQLRPSLTFLRQEASPKELKKQQKDALDAKKQFDQLSEETRLVVHELKAQLNELKKRESQVAVKHGKIASKVLAKYFGDEAAKSEAEASTWLRTRRIFYISVLIIIVLNILFYLLILVFGNTTHKIPIKTTDVFTIEYAIFKVALISLLSYGLGFASKNYNIQSNSAYINRHRMNVASTIDDFLETNPEPEVRSQIIKQGTDSMFRHSPSGYIGKNEPKENGLIHETINNMLSGR